MGLLPPAGHAETVYADRLRSAAVEGLIKHSEEILANNIIEFEGEEDFACYIRRMLAYDEYAGETELFVLSKELGMAIEIYILTDAGLREIQAYPGSLPPIRLLFQPSGPHYDALVPEPTFWAKSRFEKKAFVKWKFSRLKERINSKVRHSVNSILRRRFQDRKATWTYRTNIHV